jgi:uncharacterized protein DUF4136
MTRPLSFPARIALVALWILPLAACAAVTVNSYSQRSFDIGRYHTYAWGPPDTHGTGDPRVDNNRFFEERVRQQVDRELAARGFEKVAGVADLLIHYHASFSQKLDVRTLDRQYEPCAPGDCSAFVYDAGTLMVDLVDARANTLLWRGWAEGSMDGAIDNQAWLESRVDDAVLRILRRLPPAAPARGAGY